MITKLVLQKKIVENFQFPVLRNLKLFTSFGRIQQNRIQAKPVYFIADTLGSPLRNIEHLVLSSVCVCMLQAAVFFVLVTFTLWSLCFLIAMVHISIALIFQFSLLGQARLFLSLFPLP